MDYKQEEKTLLERICQIMQDSAGQVRLTTGRPNSSATREDALRQVAMLETAKNKLNNIE